MELYLLRHGVAEGQAASGRDADRALTAEGEAGVRLMAAKAKEAGCAPDVVVASPYLRAQRTARITAEVLGYSGELLISSRLTPDVAPVELWNEVRDFESSASVLLVAHEPLLSAAASWMVGESRVVIGFRPGTLVRIDFEMIDRAPRGVMRWKV